jgi:hypothetical protein
MNIKRQLSNVFGWRTSRKIVVFESDDWGSIRMPSLDAYRRLKEKGFVFNSGDGQRYSENDTLASKSDLSELFNVLIGFKGENGKHPVFTALALSANPDFAKIEEKSFEKYYFEPFTETLKKYNKLDAFEMWRSGYSEGLFVPEFHGREHLNVNVWLKALKARDKPTLEAFKESFWAIKTDFSRINYQEAFNLNSLKEDVGIQKEIIETGLDLFEKIHGHRASYMVPPNGYFNRELEKITSDKGIKYMCTEKIKKEPIGNGKLKKSFHYLGQKNRLGQLYITRNAFFEPNDVRYDWVDKCLNDIELAFKWNKPAVISTHRTNYIGSLNIKNRELGLRELSKLLKALLKRWPNIEFMSSSDLGALMSR